MKYRHRLIEDMVLELILPALIGLARIRGALAGDVLGEIDGRRSFCRRMVAFQLESAPTAIPAGRVIIVARLAQMSGRVRCLRFRHPLR